MSAFDQGYLAGRLDAMIARLEAIIAKLDAQQQAREEADDD